MTILCGIPNTSDKFLEAARDTDSPVLVSANAFWDDRAQSFRGHQKLWETDTPLALDCGGFVAMSKYGRYRWSILDYVELATEMRPIWWAAMDYCCEPEIAADREEVRHRIRATVVSLAETLATVCTWNRELPGYRATLPMPVIQGWKPEDYELCAKLVEDHILCDPVCPELGIGGWPALVGVGSVCRRQLTGPDGLGQVIETLDRILPPHTKLHLFGVKSKAAEIFAQHPRVESCDSMAWNMAARWEAFRARTPKTQEFLAGHMRQWIHAQRRRTQPDQLCLGI